MEMRHCMHCGAKLENRFLESEGREIPYCPECREFRFPVFNTAVSMIVTTEDRNSIVLIKQYGRDSYILVAGYVNKGENAENAVKREVFEEMGLNVTETHFNRSHYFAKSNTLMLNFTAVVSDCNVQENEEIDSYSWFTPDEAEKNIRRDSLAEAFLKYYLHGEWDFDK